MFMFNLLFQLLVATAPAFSADLPNVPITGEASRCAALLSPQAHTANHVAAEQSFRHTLSRILDEAGVDESVKEKIYLAVNDLDVREADIEPNQIKIRAKFRGESLFSRKKGRFLLRWPSEQKLNGASDSVLSMKVAEIVGTLLFKPITTIGAYRQSQRRYISDNVEALTYKLYLQYYATPKSPETVLPEKSGLTRLLGIVLRKLLPFQKSEYRAVQLDQTIAGLFDLGDPPAVFGYLRRFYAPPLALDYWVRHAKNGGMVVAMTFALYMSPTVADTWQLMRQEGSVTIFQEDQALAKGILENFEKSDIQMVNEIKSQTNDTQEAEILAQFLARYENEIQKPK